MARLVLYVVGIALLVAGAVWLADAPGTATIEWRGWRIDTTASVLVAAMIAAVLLVLLLLRGLAVVGALVHALAAARRERRLKRGLASLADGFAAVQAGHGGAARKFAKEATTLLQPNPAVLMLRKEAAELAGDAHDMKEAATALLDRPQTALAGLRSLAGKALADGDTAGALGHARQALARKDAPAWALRMALDLEIAAGRWQEAVGLMNGKLAAEVFAPADHARLKTQLLIQRARADLRAGDAQSAATHARQAMDAGGAPIAATATYAKAMAAQGKGRKAAGVVEKAWSQTPHPDLLAAYRALVPGESALDWAKRVDALARTAPDHPESKIAVARASLDASLWGQARSRLTPLVTEASEPGVRARAAHMLAEVEDRERGDSERAAAWLKLALEAREERRASAPAPRTVADLLVRT